MVIWIGISGTGKTTLGKYFYSNFKKIIQTQFILMRQVQKNFKK